MISSTKAKRSNVILIKRASRILQTARIIRMAEASPQQWINFSPHKRLQLDSSEKRIK